VIVEVIFALPGLGQFAINGVLGRDYPVIQGYVLLSGTIFVTVNLLIDVVYVLINPQIRLGAVTR
jgi:peptide/nickel transport system permease protein